MAYSTILKPSDYFNTKLYTGNDTASTTISGVGFQSDFTWIKSRTTTENHHAFDAVRGGGYRIYPNLTDAQSYIATTLTSWTSDGFVVGVDDGVNANGENFASWNWKANGAGSANTDGDINSTVSANTTSGFSIVNYTGTLSGSGNPTVGHGLGVAPQVMIIKSASNGENWGVQHTSLPANYLLQLNTTSAQINSASQGTLTAPTSSVFTVNYSGEWGNSGQNYIAYCFAEKQGYSKFGSYIGNGNNDGTFVYLGFKPAFLIIKNTAISDNWSMFNNKALGYNTYNHIMYPDLALTESNGLPIDFYSNGFKWRTSAAMANGNGNNHIYLAFAETPFVANSGESIPTTAR